MNVLTPAVRLLATAVLACFASALHAQQDYPNRPIRIIVPYAPGGSTHFPAKNRKTVPTYDGGPLPATVISR